MVKCPKCGEELDGLRHIQSGLNYYDCWVEDGEMQYQHDEFEPDDDVNEWRCPSCDNLLFDSEEEAVAFLLGRKKR